MDILAHITCADVAKNIIAMRDELIEVDLKIVQECFYSGLLDLSMEQKYAWQSICDTISRMYTWCNN